MAPGGPDPYARAADGSALDPAAFQAALRADPEKLAALEADPVLRDVLLGSDVPAMQALLQQAHQARRGGGHGAALRCAGGGRSRALLSCAAARSTQHAAVHAGKAAAPACHRTCASHHGLCMQSKRCTLLITPLLITPRPAAREMLACRRSRRRPKTPAAGWRSALSMRNAPRQRCAGTAGPPLACAPFPA